MWKERMIRRLFVAALCLWPGLASAEWASQTIVLQPGWNAVFLEVQPYNNTCDAVFRDVPIKSVWAWNQRYTSAQYVRDPSELVPESPEWLTYFPKNSARSFLTDLYAVHGASAYLIECDSAQPVEWKLNGQLMIRKQAWLSKSFNLVGFHVDPAAPPTFGDFFGPSKAHASKQFYRLSDAGDWAKVANPAAETLRSGEAYWIYADNYSTYSGPLEVELQTGRVLNYGAQATELEVTLRNASTTAKTVTLDLTDSHRPPSLPTTTLESKPVAPLAGGVALAYQQLISWSKLEGPLEVEVAPKGETIVRLACIRRDMPKAGSEGAIYESVLNVRDGVGGLYRVPVTAQKSEANRGLWVGTATVTGISEASNPQDPLTPKPTASELDFRLILHVDDDDNAQFLQECVLMQVQPVLGPDPEDPDFEIELEPSRYVILTDDTLIPEFEGMSLRDGELVGRRISTPIFSWTTPVESGDPPAPPNQPLSMTGKFPNTLEVTMTLDYNDPLNPFVHRFHPDHDNMDERYENTLSEGRESFTIVRTVVLTFSVTSPNGLNDADWGDTLMGGEYSETISGIHDNDIHIRGQFQLNRILDVAELNDGRK